MKKKILYMILMIGGIALAFTGLLMEEEFKSIGGICLGIGAGLFGMSVSNLILLSYVRRHPEQTRQSEIEPADERNTMIRNRAKAKSADIIQWFIVGIAYLTIMIQAPL